MINIQIIKYISNEINIEELVHYFNTYNYTNIEIKNKGIIYTPKYISDYIVNNLKPKLNETIFEPSVGHGIFIFSLLEYIENTFKLSPIELKNYFLKNVFFQDLNKINIDELIIIIISYFKKKNIIININEIKNFKIGNTLLNNKYYDIILGNPPYIRNQNINKNTLDFLKNNFISCKSGNIDIYYAFMEYALKNSNRFSFIVPNSWLFNKSAKKLRILFKKDLVSIINFKNKSIFNNASTYTSIFLIDKNKTFEYIKYKEDLNDKSINYNKNKLDDNKWLFYNKIKNNLNIKIINFHTPIATLRDNIYINHNLKNEDIIPLFKITKLKNEKDFYNNSKNIIFPYNNDLNEKKEEQLNENTLNYLKENKKELLKRDKGKQNKYKSWFSYGRKQGLNKYKNNTYLIPIPNIIKENQKFFSIERNKLNEQFLISSGFLIEVDLINKNKILDFLNNKDFNYILKNEGKVWKSSKNNNYYSLTITQLKNILKY